MQTIILIDRLGHELKPLTDHTGVALLPVAAKPLIEYTLEMLAGAGIKEATLVTGRHTDQIREHLGDGARWGMHLAWWLGRGEEDPAVLGDKLLKDESASRLFVRGDIIMTPCMTDFIRQALSSPEKVLHGVVGNQLAGMSLIRGDGDTSQAPAWSRLIGQTADSLPRQQKINLDGVVHYLDTFKDYHQANLDAAAGRLPGLSLSGREVAIGLRQGRNTVVSPRCLEVGIAQVGNQCRIHPTARFNNEVVISNQVIVDRYASLSNAVVLPDTYIGELVNISDALVSGNDLIDIETGTVLKVVDTFLLSGLKDAPFAKGLSRGWNRLLGCLLLLLSLPFWPVALIAASLENPGEPYRIRLLRGNRVERSAHGNLQRREFKVLEWATSILPLSKLPWILAVITGDIDVVGVEAVSMRDAALRTLEWELLADRVPAGLIGPTQLNIPHTAPTEERLMSDVYFAAHRNFHKELWVLVDGAIKLLSWKTWLPSQRDGAVT